VLAVLDCAGKSVGLDPSPFSACFSAVLPCD